MFEKEVHVIPKIQFFIIIGRLLIQDQDLILEYY